eukprot:gnl/TRDRNA2_/TRDRNA2_81373_c0_seq1.p1 gnl/TRDRNA2_/TRDRNA2_81373_c0~~gnl/TRDRNA2_/TRDRNA2_81373_c0_seq1.p1  ORF type:complete len:572 (-),score=107.10 gnl/TRDRNA2_/TRDRNA2_81373_c0_seq1:106-1821(-)
MEAAMQNTERPLSENAEDTSVSRRTAWVAADTDGQTATQEAAGPADDVPPARVCIEYSTQWREDLLSQVAERDRCSDGLGELLEQYSESLHVVRTFRGGATGMCSPMEGSPKLGPRISVGSLGHPAEDLELPLAATDGTSGKDGDASELARRLAHDLRQKDLEYQATCRVLKEREDELHEKEQAHTTLSRQATQIGRENAELKAKLAHAQEEMLARNAEADKLRAEVQRLREASTATVSSDSSKVGGESRGSIGLADTSPTPMLPMYQQVSRKIHSGELSCVAAAGSQAAPLPNSLIAVGTADGFVKLLDGETARPHAQLSVSRELPRIIAVDLAPGTSLLLAASADHTCRLLDLRAQKLLHTLRGHVHPLSACGFVRNGTHAFTASADRTVKIWDLEKGQVSKSTPSSGAVTAAGAHPSSSIIATGHADGSIAVWDPREGDSWSMPSLKYCCNVVGVRISPDGRLLLSQDEDGKLCIIELGTMRMLQELAAGTSGTMTGPSPPAFSSDGAHVFARGPDRVRCWSAGTGESVCVHEVPTPTCVCWELPLAVSAHRNGSVALWGPASTEASA